MLERLFHLEASGTSVRTELFAGLTTFMTMVYIVFVHPAILADAGMDKGAVFVATCLAAAFGSAVVRAPRSFQSWNAIGDAIEHSTTLLDACPCEATRRIIDVSGDGPDMRSLTPAPIARDAAVAKGITINALAIIVRVPRIGLTDAYARDVIGGPAAFVVPVRDREKFVEAIRTKLVLEIAMLTPQARIIRASVKNPRVPCTIGERLWQERWGN